MTNLNAADVVAILSVLMEAETPEQAVCLFLAWLVLRELPTGDDEDIPSGGR